MRRLELGVGGGHACFLSHYKMEAASDARLLHDMLAKMLRYPVFLDSAKCALLAHPFLAHACSPPVCSKP